MVIHTVKAGETLRGIAALYGVSPERIISDNALVYPDSLVTGQALVILIPETVHTVGAGQSLSGIAHMYGVSETEILRLNPFLLRRAPLLYAGEQLIISLKQQKRRELSINTYVYPFVNRDILIRELVYLTYLTIFGYGFRTDGSLIEPDDADIISLAYTYGAKPVMLLSSVTDDGNFSEKKASELFNNEALQNEILYKLAADMREKGYVGLDIDFEYISPDDEDAFLAFLGKAASVMHDNGFFLNTDLAPKTSTAQQGLLYEAHNYREVGRISDRVLLMTYEWGYTYGPPMAVAPLKNVREVAIYGVSEISPEKIFLGIPNYGYDWTLPYEKGKTRAVSIGNEQAVNIARSYGAEIRFDSDAASPYFEYYDGTQKHIVWFEDARSISGKATLIDELGIYGAGYWNGMRPFTQNWALMSALYNIR